MPLPCCAFVRQTQCEKSGLCSLRCDSSKRACLPGPIDFANVAKLRHWQMGHRRPVHSRG
eukprot:scaffold1500_cov398-Prasinococcus_capsulatus_cf.AAC.19